MPLRFDYLWHEYYLINVQQEANEREFAQQIS